MEDIRLTTSVNQLNAKYCAYTMRVLLYSLFDSVTAPSLTVAQTRIVRQSYALEAEAMHRLQKRTPKHQLRRCSYLKQV